MKKKRVVSKRKLKVSVAVCTYNDGKYIKECIKKILAQNYKSFELIIANDGSPDDTDKIIRSFKDKRIKYFQFVKNHGSISKIRNFVMSKCSGEYVFFTDGDCYVSPDWIEKGLKAFEKSGADVLALEGKIIYGNESYTPTLSDKKVANSSGREYMTANMAFKRSIYPAISFDSNFDGNEDRDVALKILTEGAKIPFIPEMVIYHAIKKRTMKMFFDETKRIEKKVGLIKKYNDKVGLKWRILNWQFLLMIFFPPLIFLEIFKKRVRNLKDLMFMFLLYVKAWYMRILIWRSAIRERVFVI